MLTPTRGDVPPAVPAPALRVDHRGIGQQRTVNVAWCAAEPANGADTDDAGADPGRCRVPGPGATGVLLLHGCLHLTE